ncbi:hypothetical protein SCLCIDRAFT_350480 [Scleroderma citrinum Foug A]|uniref:Uncharacterized protein n=1 Tax=Scleroderma citrinum Foug A TaxID=1036808 RepID=A0A0C2YYG0_9AGAM|nr:hypothetical protein SCLCIDRAFT_350480 [Scleroderma citrinum Foug A]
MASPGLSISLISFLSHLSMASEIKVGKREHLEVLIRKLLRRGVDMSPLSHVQTKYARSVAVNVLSAGPIYRKHKSPSRNTGTFLTVHRIRFLDKSRFIFFRNWSRCTYESFHQPAPSPILRARA